MKVMVATPEGRADDDAPALGTTDAGADGGALPVAAAETLGLALAAAADGLPDAAALGEGARDAVAGPLRPTTTSSASATTTTRTPVRPATSVRRFRSVILTLDSEPAWYSTPGVTPAEGPSSQTRRRAIKAG
jgi:arylamine N-acetyltransferase